MLRIRTIKTGSGARAVQVIYYLNRKRVIYKHIGSAKTDSELETMLVVAQDFIDNYAPTLPFEIETKYDNLLYLDKADFLGVYYTYLYEILSAIIKKVGLSGINKQFLLDLVIMRILDPSSKLRSIELLETCFGIKHSRKSFYKSARNWLSLKEEVEQIVIKFLKENYDFNFELLFYDVTTLYFETFDADEFRKQGFSKDNKSLQPQILVALMVTPEGFPVGYEVFPGNTFEGHTILPVVKAFIQKHSIKQFTIVADAAMISNDNVEELRKAGINYIVGARLGNIGNELFQRIHSSLVREDGNTIRLQTEKGYLICSFSNTRYRKDKYEMEKQIQRAEILLKEPGKIKKVKFLKTDNKEPALNNELINRTKVLLGIKGYYTDLEESIVDNETVIRRYHDLYKIEQAFRISKNDLKTRPIFHFKEEPIKLHLLICFMALVISKHIELTTNVSIKKFVTELKKVTDARMFSQITNKEMRIRAKMMPIVEDLIRKLNLPH
ncbi:IS1634 family transposase [Sphingobacterium multivorum]|uniref:IS1634 family transposase n=1 Tax=Sphingobacterium multivorum TaxID=28454 RepID=UPI000E94347F|nr:IS1634 family transposase [Sphingobacterium multivorum]HBI89378.1 IS1634 family transposase [Sphingobacterium sp.]